MYAAPMQRQSASCKVHPAKCIQPNAFSKVHPAKCIQSSASSMFNSCFDTAQIQGKAVARVAALKARLKAASHAVAAADEARLCQEQQQAHLQADLQVMLVMTIACIDVMVLPLFYFRNLQGFQKTN